MVRYAPWLFVLLAVLGLLFAPGCAWRAECGMELHVDQPSTTSGLAPVTLQSIAPDGGKAP